MVKGHLQSFRGLEQMEDITIFYVCSLKQRYGGTVLVIGLLQTDTSHSKFDTLITTSHNSSTQLPTGSPCSNLRS